MLNGTLRLHDIRSIEDFCAALIPNSWQDKLEPHDYEDLLAYLIATAWELSLHHDPTRTSFSTRAGNTLRRRQHDWLRQRNGRTRWTQPKSGSGTPLGHVYERPRPVLVSLDTELDATLADRTVDGPEDRLSDLHRLLHPRTSPPPQPNHTLDRTPTRHAA